MIVVDAEPLMLKEYIIACQLMRYSILKNPRESARIIVKLVHKDHLRGNDPALVANEYIQNMGIDPRKPTLEYGIDYLEPKRRYEYLMGSVRSYHVPKEDKPHTYIGMAMDAYKEKYPTISSAVKGVLLGSAKVHAEPGDELYETCVLQEAYMLMVKHKFNYMPLHMHNNLRCLKNDKEYMQIEDTLFFLADVLLTEVGMEQHAILEGF